MNTFCKRLIGLTFAFLLLGANTAVAQPHHERMLDRLSEELSLSEEQENNIFAIFEAGHEECAVSASSREEHRDCMQAKREEIHAAIRAELTEEQQELFDVIEEDQERRPPRRNRGDR